VNTREEFAAAMRLTDEGKDLGRQG
jgi:hypothetical protein